MLRASATKLLRELLDSQELSHWHIRLTTDLSKPFLGLCSYKDKCIILNAHHLDTHPDPEVVNTIRHEVAHALTPHHQHDEVWRAKAVELGCDNTQACVNYSLSETAIDAIRSGAELKVEFDERTEVIRTPKYTVSRLQDKCEECGKVAKEKESKEVRVKNTIKRVVLLECGHYIIKNADYYSPFETLVFDGIPTCNHTWGEGKHYTVCSTCSARRLFPFQVEGARMLEKANGRFALLDEMRLGKAIQALAYLNFHKHDAWPFLWITKSGILYQHFKEIARVLGTSAYPYVIRSSKDKPIPGMNAIASYDVFRRMDSLEPFFGFKCIILDEVQAVKNPDSARTQCIRRIAKEIPQIIPTSGSFWKNRGSEAFVMLNLLDPKMFYSYKGFKDSWVENYWHGNKLVEGGFRNPTKFREKISHIAIRRERKDVAAWLPTVNRTRVICEVPTHARASYKEEEDKLFDLIKDSILEGTESTFANKAAVQQSIMVMRQIVGIAKVPATIDFAKEFIEETGKNLTIFVHHKACARMIRESLDVYFKENDSLPCLVLSADMNAFERGKTAEEFNKATGRVLVASTLASGEGISLNGCSDCIMHERQWNPMNESQAEDRFPHFDSDSTSINATYMHAEDTTDDIIDGLVERKRRAFESSMNKDGYVNVWNLDLTDEILKAIIKKRSKK